jgi:myxalamid-type polyketide synthase MxaD
MNTRSCSDRWARFIVWDTRLTGNGSIRPEAGAFDSRSTRGNGSVVGLSPLPGTPALTGGKPPGAGQETIFCWAGISKRRHPAGTHFWETTLDKNSLPYLDDHRIQGVAVLPASAYVEMALAAAVEVFGAQSVALKDIEFRKALFLPEGGTRTIQVILSPGADGTASFHIYSCSGKAWTLHATGKICLAQDDSIIAPGGRAGDAYGDANSMRREDLRPGLLPETRRKRHPLRSFLSEHRPVVAEQWRCVGRSARARGAGGGVSWLSNSPGNSRCRVAGFGAAVAAEATENGRQGIHLPTRIDQFRVHGRPGRHLWSHTRVQHREANATTGEVQLLDEAGRVAVEIQGLRFEYLGDDTPRAVVDNLDDWLYEFQWQPKERAAGKPSAPASRASWLIFTDSGGVGDALSALLEARGERSILVARGETYEQTDGQHFRIRSERPEDIRRLFEVAMASDQPGCRGIVHLWSLDVAVQRRPPWLR